MKNSFNFEMRIISIFLTCFDIGMYVYICHATMQQVQPSCLVCYCSIWNPEQTTPDKPNEGDRG
jgi:hypothetical protein